MSADAASLPTLDLVCLGEAMVEFNQSPDEPTRYTAGFGGDTSNCAIAAARIGARSGYITQIGDDVFGARLLALWRDEGVDTAGVRVLPGGDTGVYFVTHGPNGHEFSYLRSGSAASRMEPASLPLAVIGGAVLVVDLRMFGLGFRNQPVAAVATAARPWLIGSLALILLTGYLLFSSLAAGKYYWNFAWWWKMYFLLAAIVYTFTVRQPFALRRAVNASAGVAKLVAGVSIFLWLGVAVMGRAIGFI